LADAGIKRDIVWKRRLEWGAFAGGLPSRLEA